MFSLVSKLKFVVVSAGWDWQVPEKVPFLFPELVQVATLPVTKLRSENEGPVSEITWGFVGDDPGTISIWRFHFSTFHDWYFLDLSAQTVVVFKAAAAILVVMLSVGLAPALVVFGTQKELPSVEVQLKSRLIEPVANPSDLSIAKHDCQTAGVTEGAGGSPLFARAGKRMRQIHCLDLPVNGKRDCIVCTGPSTSEDAIAPDQVRCALEPALPGLGPLGDTLVQGSPSAALETGRNRSEVVGFGWVGAIISHVAETILEAGRGRGVA